MTGAVATSACPLCGGSIGAGDDVCPRCRATPQWQDYVRAIDFARQEYANWRTTGIINLERSEAIRARFDSMRQQAIVAANQGRTFPPDTGLASCSTCWHCNRAVGRCFAYCNRCGAALGASADVLRYLEFLLREVEKTGARELSVSQAQACAADVRAHITSVRNELELGQLSGDALTDARLSQLRQQKNRLGNELPVQTKPRQDAISAATQSTAPSGDETARAITAEQQGIGLRRTVLEILLDPQNIQWLLGSGGVLLIVGGVIWLASLGVFRNPLVVAVSMGVGTIGLMAGGFSSIKFTRYQLAGRAITLLACLAMPLNLWFYHAHGLVTLDGHLWVAALVCCVLYATAALVLEDPIFVYVLSAGVAMTGLLILADLHKLMEIASPATLLIVLGLIALHAERAFAVGDGPFTRKRFGMACFWSAQVLLGAGLVLLMAAQVGSQVIAWLPTTATWLPQGSVIVTDPSQRLLAIALVAAGAYAYLYSGLLVRRSGAYLYAAAGALLWGEWLVIDLAHLTADRKSVV